MHGRKLKSKYGDCKCYLEYVEVQRKILKLKCLTLNKKHEKKFKEDLIKV